MELAEKIAEVVLYEGYLLYPYRRSAIKNQQRWNFGGVYPRAYSEESGDEPWTMQTQCLLVGDEDTGLAVTVRFLQVVDRRVGTYSDTAAPRTLRLVEELRVGEQVHRPWEEAIERSVAVGEGDAEEFLRLGDLVAHGGQHSIDVPAGSAEEPLLDPAGEAVGALVRAWRSLRGTVEIAAERLPADRLPADRLPADRLPADRLEEHPEVGRGDPEGGAGAGSGRHPYRLTVRIANTTPWTLGEGGAMQPRQAALRQAFISTHTILRTQGGAFVSLLEPPPAYQEAARACANVKTWPVLIGEPGERHTLLSSPIILYDYPQIAPESPGNLFDTTEIDELLTLSIMTLTDAEKQEMRASDARAREILERTEALSPEQLMKLHGAIRGLRQVRREEA